MCLITNLAFFPNYGYADPTPFNFWSGFHGWWGVGWIVWKNNKKNFRFLFFDLSWKNYRKLGWWRQKMTIARKINYQVLPIFYFYWVMADYIYNLRWNTCRLKKNLMKKLNEKSIIRFLGFLVFEIWSFKFNHLAKNNCKNNK